jgi:hypothetical protein
MTVVTSEQPGDLLAVNDGLRLTNKLEVDYPLMANAGLLAKWAMISAVSCNSSASQGIRHHKTFSVPSQIIPTLGKQKEKLKSLPSLPIFEGKAGERWIAWLEMPQA